VGLAIPCPAMPAPSRGPTRSRPTHRRRCPTAPDPSPPPSRRRGLTGCRRSEQRHLPAGRAGGPRRSRRTEGGAKPLATGRRRPVAPEPVAGRASGARRVPSAHVMRVFRARSGLRAASPPGVHRRGAPPPDAIGQGAVRSRAPDARGDPSGATTSPGAMITAWTSPIRLDRLIPLSGPSSSWRPERGSRPTRSSSRRSPRWQHGSTASSIPSRGIWTTRGTGTGRRTASSPAGTRSRGRSRRPGGGCGVEPRPVAHDGPGSTDPLRPT